MRTDRILPYLRSRPEGVLLLAALVVRLLGIAARPIWYDEAFAVLFASQSPARMAYGTLAPDALGSTADIHPLGYYTLLWAWMGVFGRSIIAGRILSVLISCAAFWLAIRLMKGLFGEQTAWWAGVFLALSPFHVHYSQEIRMYGLLAFFLIGATFVYSRALGLFADGNRHGAGNWILFTVFSAAAMYTHNLAAFYLAPLALIPFWLPALRGRFGTAKRKRDRTHRATSGIDPAVATSTPRPSAHSPIRPFPPPPIRPFAASPLRPSAHSPIRNTLLASTAAALLYLPWLVHLPGQLARVGTAYWTQPPGGDRFVTTLLTFVSNLPVSQVLLPFALLAAFLTLALSVWQTLKAILQRPRRESLVPGLILAYLAFIPPMLMFVVSQFFPVYIERALLPSGILFLLWVAWALIETGIPRFVRLFATIALLVGMFIGLQTHLTYSGFPYAPFDDVNAAIRASIETGGGSIRTGTVIVHSNKLTALPAHLLDPDLPHRYLPDIPGSGSDTLALPTQNVIGLFADEDIAAAIGDATRVWFVVFRQEVDEYLTAGESAHPQLAWLDERFTRISSERWDDLIVYEYAAP